MVAANLLIKVFNSHIRQAKNWLSIYLWDFEWSRCLEKGNWNWKFTESKYETEIETEFWTVNLYVENVNTDCHFWYVYPMKMRVLPSFLIATGLKSLKLHINLRLRIEIGKVNLNKEPGIYKRHLCNVDATKKRVLP